MFDKAPIVLFGGTLIREQNVKAFIPDMRLPRLEHRLLIKARFDLGSLLGLLPVQDAHCGVKGL